MNTCGAASEFKIDIRLCVLSPLSQGGTEIFSGVLKGEIEFFNIKGGNTKMRDSTSVCMMLVSSLLSHPEEL